MAEYWSNNDRGYRLRLWIDQVSQNVGANNSQVRVRLALLNTNVTFASYACSAWVEVNGQRLTWSGSPSMLSNNSSIMLIDQTVTIGHNADGTKSFGLSAQFSGGGGWSPNTLSISGNAFTLTTIPRASTVSVGEGVIGSPLTITINRQNASFKHTIRYAWGTMTGTIASNVDTQATWTIPTDFAKGIPNAISGTGVIYVDTYSGSTKTGTQQTSFTATVPASMKPTFSGLTLVDSNTVTQPLLSGNNFLQILSNVQVSFNGGSGSYGSTITGYRAELVNRNQATSQNGGTLGIMNFTGSATIRAYVVDSRGRQSDTKDVTINVLEYFAPTLSFSATRTRESPQIIQVVRNARIAPIRIGGSQKNTMKLTFKVAELGSQSFTADTGSATGTYTTMSELINSAANLAGNYTPTKSFTIIGTLSDRFTSTEFSATVATEKVVMSYNKDGRVGIGKIVERGALDVKGNIYANDQEIQHWKMTTNDGRALVVAGGGDWNNVTETGFYMADKMANRPESAFGWKYVRVTKHNDLYVLQEAIDFYGDISAYRVKKNGQWTAWKYYAVKGEAVSFTTVNQTKVYQATIAGPYGSNMTVVRCGNVVNANLNFVINAKVNVANTVAIETIPSGYRPVIDQNIRITGNGGAGTSASLYTGSYVDLTYKPNGQIGYRVKLDASPLAFIGSMTWITQDPFPS